MAWWDFIGDVWDWFEDSDTAQDIVGSLLQQSMFDKPELDYAKLKEMAVQQALIDSPDQNTPTMISDWTVDPKTGARTQNLSYRPEFQGLLDSLVGRVNSPKTPYRAPESMTGGLLGSRINTLETQSGLPLSQHQRGVFPEITGFSMGPSGPSGPPTGNPPSGPAGNGPGAGNPPGHVNPNEPPHEDPPNGGPGPAGNHGGYDPFDSSFDNQNLIRDLVDRGYMQPGQGFGDVDWDSVFSDGNLEFVEKWGDNKIVKFFLNKLIPGGGVASDIASWFAGRELDQRAGQRLSDFDNRQWGSFDTGGIGQGDFSDSYWQDLLGKTPGVNPRTGARLGEAGGMPGATQNWNDIMRELTPPRDVTDMPGFQTGNNYGREAFGTGSRYGGRLGESVFGGGMGDNYSGFSGSRDFASAVREFMQNEGLTWSEAVRRLIAVPGEDQRTP